jgi:hypothetical protein
MLNREKLAMGLPPTVAPEGRLERAEPFTLHPEARRRIERRREVRELHALIDDPLLTEVAADETVTT